MNNHPDVVDALRVVSADASREVLYAVGALVCVATVVAVFFIGAFPEITRLWRRWAAHAKSNRVLAVAEALFVSSMMAWGGAKFVFPVYKVATDITSTHVRLEWELRGREVDARTQFIVSRLEESEPGVTNKVQYALVNGETTFHDDVENADQFTWIVEYLPPQMVFGDDIRITKFQYSPSGLRIEWDTIDKIVQGDIFTVERRWRAIPARTGWSSWEVVSETTDRFYQDSDPHYHRDEQWRVSCTKAAE